MQTTDAAPGRSWAPAAAPSALVGLSTAVVVGTVVGALTAYGQGWLSDAASSLANSAGPWSLAAFVVARYNRRIASATAAAMTTLACCELGYAIATELRGGSNARSTVVFWLVAAVLAGPPLGVAGAWSTERGLRRSAGFGVVAGVLIGEGLYGWTTVADTTDWRYWAAELLLGVIIAVVVALRSHGLRYRLAAIAMATLTATVVFAAGRLA